MGFYSTSPKVKSNDLKVQCLSYLFILLKCPSYCIQSKSNHTHDMSSLPFPDDGVDRQAVSPVLHRSRVCYYRCAPRHSGGAHYSLSICGRGKPRQIHRQTDDIHSGRVFTALQRNALVGAAVVLYFNCSRHTMLPVRDASVWVTLSSLSVMYCVCDAGSRGREGNRASVQAHLMPHRGRRSWGGERAKTCVVL